MDETMVKIYDLIIIGSGPAGLAAGIYAQRAQLDAIIIEKSGMSGGQVLTTYEVDNYPGVPGIGGFELGMKFREHADRLEAEFVEDEVLQIELEGKIKKVICERETYQTKAIVIATGADHKKLGIPGEEVLTGAGVSYCATCDGAFFKNKITAVVGGGDVALEDAVFLSRMCKKVYLIHRRDAFRGAKSLQEKLFASDNIEVIWDSMIEEIRGENHVEGLTVINAKTRNRSFLSVNGIFIAVGIIPNSQVFEGLLETEKGYIVASEDGVTSVPGIYAAGDVRTKLLRQIVTAVSDGANVITGVERYLSEN